MDTAFVVHRIFFAAHRSSPIVVAVTDSRCFTLSRLDGVTVATADGRGVVYRNRDRAMFWRLLWQVLLAHGKLFRKSPATRRRYTAARPRLAAIDAWEQVFRSTPGTR